MSMGTCTYSVIERQASKPRLAHLIAARGVGSEQINAVRSLLLGTKRETRSTST
jgi:hypothetical protein